MTRQQRPGERAYADWSWIQVAAGRCGCWACGGSLSDAERDPDGWAYCWRCACAYRLREEEGGQLVVAVWPRPDHCATEAAELAAWISAHVALVGGITWRRWKVRA